MKTLLKLLPVALFLVAIAFVYTPHKKRERQIAIPSIEKPFVIIISSYNKSSCVEKNLQSIFKQSYENFRIIYIDDASTDDTYEKAEKYISHNGKKERVTLLHNEKNRGTLANFYHAIHRCHDEEIVVALDGDEFLAHEDLLSKLNKIYSEGDVWMVYSSSLDHPNYKTKIVPCKKIPASVVRHNSFRKHEWGSFDLRSFYAGLFKQIKLQDLLLKGRFYPMADDLAMAFPLLEMAGKHARFTSDILYLHNRANSLKYDKANSALQEECAKEIRKARPYTPLQILEKKAEKSETADLLVFSYDRPMQLYALLESVERHIKHLDTTSVLYRTSSQDFADGYDEVKRRFPHVRFVQQTSHPTNDFKPLFLQIAALTSPMGYILFAVDDIIVKDEIDLRQCIQALKETHAYGFYLCHSPHIDQCYMLNCPQKIPPHVAVQTNIFAWPFKEGEHDWNYPNSVDMVLYRKADIAKDLQKISFRNPNTLESEWAKKSKRRSIGLFFDQSKCVNIPLNLVNLSTNRHGNSYSPADLLKKFQAGLKIDTTPLLHIDNHSKHMDWEPLMCPR